MAGGAWGAAARVGSAQGDAQPGEDVFAAGPTPPPRYCFGPPAGRPGRVTAPGERFVVGLPSAAVAAAVPGLARTRATLPSAGAFGEHGSRGPAESAPPANLSASALGLF